MTTLEELTELERIVAAGNVAMAQRNRLIVQLAEAGHRQSDIMRAVNAVRQEMGDKPVTLGAIHILLRRAKVSAS